MRSPSDAADAGRPGPHVCRALRQLAETAARAGGAVARRAFGRRQTVRLKPDRSEVTAVDEAAQRAVVECIRRVRGTDAFIAEEELHVPRRPAADPAPSPGRAARAVPALTWVIDPLDGTRNFIRAIPCFTCAVAALLDGRPIVGAVYDPARDVLYSASLAEGFFVNRLRAPPLARRAPRRTRGTRFLVGIPSLRHRGPRTPLHDWVDAQVNRNLGSTALHFALVAAGHLDAVLAEHTHLWDVAAGCLLVSAAGGRTTRPDGSSVFPVELGSAARRQIPVFAASPQAYRAAFRKR